jgi:rhodanese-related sulfurtransferase
MSTAIQHFSPREAYAEYIRGGGVIVDVRDREEVASKSLGIKQLVAVPLNELEGRLAEIPANRTVMLVSRIGVKGREAAIFLAARGFAKLALVEGGMTAWESEGLPVNHSA